MSQQDLFPAKVWVDDLAVEAYPNKDSLFARLIYEAKSPEQAIVLSTNVHFTNIVRDNPDVARLARQADVNYCDGAGIKLGARLLGQYIPTRLTAADWIFDLFAAFANAGLTVYYLGGEQHVIDRARQVLARKPHSVVGMHHGYLSDPDVEAAVLEEIRALKPDVLMVGMGMPLQERWIAKHRHSLPEVGLFWAVGAVLDYHTGKVSRCPEWMGRWGLEWFYRLMLEPDRMFERYVMGNPRFLCRILYNALATPPPLTKTKTP
jgi:N-acetylglucosaminyldiphosphoundecaprenol N-acetyl-beta-D-mannosaminyltransferase